MSLFFDDDGSGPADDRPMTLSEHLDELRKRVVWCVLVALAFIIACAVVEEQLVGIALAPAYSVLRDVKGGQFISTEVSEKFVTGVKVDIVVGLFLASPAILYLLWGFVARGLHSHEKRFVRIYAPVSYLLFIAGCSFFYFEIQPLTLRFLLNWHADDLLTLTGERINVSPMLTMTNTVSFFLSMTLVTGLIFEMPLVMLFLQAIRICSWRTYLKYSRHFVFGLTVVAAVVTPTPDAFTLTVFMIPVLALFFGGVLVCRMMAPPDIE